MSRPVPMSISIINIPDARELTRHFNRGVKANLCLGVFVVSSCCSLVSSILSIDL